MRLTAATVKVLAIPAGKTEAFFWDEGLPGFGVRLRSGGKKVYVVQYRAGQKQRRVTLGSLDVLAIEEARQRARRTLLQVGDGADPQAEKLAARTVRPHEFLQLANDYLARHGKKRLKPRSYQEVERHLLRHWKPLHRSAIAKITRADVAAGLAKLSTENGAGVPGRSSNGRLRVGCLAQTPGKLRLVGRIDRWRRRYATGGRAAVVQTPWCGSSTCGALAASTMSPGRSAGTAVAGSVDVLQGHFEPMARHPRSEITGSGSRALQSSRYDPWIGIAGDEQRARARRGKAGAMQLLRVAQGDG